MKKTRLAAIMFTDIAGYSAIMERDENLAMEVLLRHNSILLPLIENFEGSTVDAIGDGLLVVFDSAYSACNCAINIQNAIDSSNNSTESTEKFLVRIGVHMGDIWYEANRIYGNGVNIAARILPFSKAGGICVSDDVFRQLKNKTDIEIRPLGKKKMKNIEQPVGVYELVTGCEQPSESVVPVAMDIDEYVNEKIEEGKEQARRALGMEKRFETRILSFVENAMGKALNTWEKVPQEKRRKLIDDFREQDWYVEAKFQKEVEPDTDEEDKESKESSRELIPVGIVGTLGFGIALLYFNALWLIFPLIFIGLIPLGIGISQLIYKRSKKGPQEREKHAIQAAQRHGGRLSVMQLASESSLSLDDAQVILDEMAKKGYIGQEIDGNGLITYTFPELLDSS